jgi:hypothetical protein
MIGNRAMHPKFWQKLLQYLVIFWSSFLTFYIIGLLSDDPIKVTAGMSAIIATFITGFVAAVTEDIRL